MSDSEDEYSTYNSTHNQCYNCVRKRVCFLPSNIEVGWCEECNFCRICCREDENKLTPITHRVEWRAGPESLKLWLCHDVCEEHSKDSILDCCCSIDAKNGER
jgi:hypothetical protein